MVPYPCSLNAGVKVVPHFPLIIWVELSIPKNVAMFSGLTEWMTVRISGSYTTRKSDC
jgi:hypothetical protein